MSSSSSSSTPYRGGSYALCLVLTMDEIKRTFDEEKKTYKKSWKKDDLILNALRLFETKIVERARRKIDGGAEVKNICGVEIGKKKICTQTVGLDDNGRCKSHKMSVPQVTISVTSPSMSTMTVPTAARQEEKRSLRTCLMQNCASVPACDAVNYCVLHIAEICDAQMRRPMTTVVEQPSPPVWSVPATAAVPPVPPATLAHTSPPPRTSSKPTVTSRYFHDPSLLMDTSADVTARRGTAKRRVATVVAT